MEVVDGSGEEGCRTPRRGGCQIPATSVCPPPPRKKKAVKKQGRPKKGYFQAPELDMFFALMAPAAAARRDPYYATA